jgi:hypothetical protein
MEEREPLGKRLRRFVTLFGIVFTVTVAVIVTQRLSNDALALLIGLTAGVIVMLPFVALLFLIWRRQERQVREQYQSRSAQGNPPVVVVTPTGLPGYGQQRPALRDEGRSQWSMSAPAERKFTIVGGEG